MPKKEAFGKFAGLIGGLAKKTEWGLWECGGEGGGSIPKCTLYIWDLHNEQQQSQQLLEQNQQMIHEQQQQHQYQKQVQQINTLKIYNYCNNNSNNKVIAVKKRNIKKYSNNKENLKTKTDLYM